MRGNAWLVGLVCVLLVLVPTAAFSGAQQPKHDEAHGENAADAAQLQEWTGQSVLHFKGACVDERARCVADVEREDGSFFLPSTAQGGHVVVSWRPVDESLRVLRARVAGIEVTGESPLRVEFIGLIAGAHEVRLEPVGRVVGFFDQTADWVATFAVNPSPVRVDMRGATTFAAGAGCILATCDPFTQIASDPFVVPWTARGSLVADWDAREGALRIAIPGTGFVAEGEPPLTLPLDGLAAGEWTLDARPARLGAPLGEVSVGWGVALEPAR